MNNEVNGVPKVNCKCYTYNRTIYCQISVNEITIIAINDGLQTLITWVINKSENKEFDRIENLMLKQLSVIENKNGTVNQSIN